ncbi:hypothetical protein JCM3775_001879 [Rhodotorula graminis]
MAAPPPAPPPGGATPAPHLVSLKVLRATRPALVQPCPLHVPVSPGARAAGTLSLPTSFANIYLGETFNAVLSLSNDLVVPPSTSTSTSTSAQTALSPVLHVEMHTNLGAPTPVKHLLAHVDPSTSSSLSLSSPTSSSSSSSTAPPPRLASLAPGQALPALVVAHELKELGPHALVCTVSYGVEVGDGGGGGGADAGVQGGAGGAGTRVVTRSFRKP